MEQLSELIEKFGIYAVFILSSVEGDMTLLVSGVMANAGFFGEFGFWKVVAAGTLGGMAGDIVAYLVGRLAHEKAKQYRFYRAIRPRVERLIEKFGTAALILSKYIYGIRTGVCLFYGIAKMPFYRFVVLDAISCLLWVLVLAGSGYFFSGAVRTFFEDFGIALALILLVVIAFLYFVERYWLSSKVEDADPETFEMIEEKFHEIEDVAQEKLHEIGEKLHFGKSSKKEAESAKKEESKDD
jgi:membrane protein DedA with SNARE-associated domain